MAKVPLKDISMERVRVEEFGNLVLWMSQSCFSLGFLSQNSLWKLSTFRGYECIYRMVCMECKESVTTKHGVLVTRPRDWNESRV